MILHSKCGTPLLGDLSSRFKLRVSFAVTKKGLKVGIADLCFDEKAACEFSEFYCPACKCKVEEDEMEIRCYQCGHKITLSESGIPVDGGGIYCPEHIKMFEPDGFVPVLDIFKNIYFS